MTNSITCPICGNLCSSMAATCPKCGHPFNQPNNVTASNPQPFIIVFKILAYISLAVGVICGAFIVLGVPVNLLSGELNVWLREKGYSFILFFIIGFIFYAIFSFLISNANKKG